MTLRKSRLLLVILVTVSAFGLVATTATAQTVDSIDVTLNDESGDGLDDSITVDVSVTDDGGATAVEFDAPFSLDLSETDTSQADIVSVNDDQPKENVTFGSFEGYTGTYTVKGTLSGQTDGDLGNVTAWVGDTERSAASDIQTQSFTATESEGGTVNDLSVTLSDTNGDGLDDRVEVNAEVTEDGGTTVVEFDSGTTVDLSATDGGQASVVSINDNQANENVTFGSTGYSGTYTVVGDLSRQSGGDTGTVTAWVGDIDPSAADDTAEADFTVSSSGSTGPVSISSPSEVEPGGNFQVDVDVDGDGGATVVEFDAPFSVNLSGTDESQASIVSVNDDQPKENVTFGSLGYTGTYTVDVDLEGGSFEDSIGITSWIGSTERSSADAETTRTVDVVNATGVTVEWCPDGVSQTVCEEFADENGNPAPELQVVRVLTGWSDTNEISGESVDELQLIRVLTGWSSAGQ
jgi:hypothetical protein